MVTSLVRSGKERAFLIAACVAILVGAALFFIGEWGTGIGSAGVINKLIRSIGFGVLGAGVLTIGVLFAMWFAVELKGLVATEGSKAARQLMRQVLTVAMNLLVYGAIFILALGALAALDDASPGTIIVVLVVWALCIAGFIAYRRYRKAHKAGYDLAGCLGLALFMLLVGIGLLGLSIMNASAASRDLQSGPRTTEVFLVDAWVDNPSYRYRFAVQSQHVLTFFTPEEERIVLEVPDADISSAKPINDYGNFVHLEYYPETQTFGDATPWPEGRQVMGEELLGKLKETYDFEM